MFGWNNSAAQTNLPNATFTTVTIDTYSVTEEWETLSTENIKDGNGKPVKVKTINTHNATSTSTQNINSNIAFDLRKANQINGINLSGANGTQIISGDAIPHEGDIVVDRQNDRNSNPNQILDGVHYPTDTTVSKVEKTNTMTMLYVNFGGVSIPLPNTPVITTVTQ